jgi:very-short-patch-repair endonuclease
MREPDKRIPRARRLRHEMTHAERKLWQQLRAMEIKGTHFRRQATIGPYFADFACHERRLIIEVDGGQHNEPAHVETDSRRTAFLNSRGYCVLRFWNNEVLGNIEEVMKVIVETLGKTTAPHP